MRTIDEQKGSVEIIDFNQMLEDLEEQEINNMNEESKQSVFGHGNFDEDDNTYLKFTPENKNIVTYKMLEDEPVTKPNKFDKPQHTFEVMCLDTKRVMSHSITSKRYMRSLEQYVPLAGKSFAVERIGELMETDYIVKPIL